jgi:hypothetical protein
MANTIINNSDCPPKIIKIISPGPKGDKGDKGDGFSGGSGSFTISGSLIIGGDLFVSGGISASSFFGSGDNLFFNRIGTNETGSSRLIIGNYNDVSGAYFYRQTTVFENGDVIISGSLITLGPVTAPEFSGSLFGTASWAERAITASYALTASYIENLGYGDTWKHFQYTPSTTWSFSHYLGEQWPNVTVYDLNNTVIQPGEIVGLNTNDMEVRFNIPQTGIVVLSVGGLATTASVYAVNAATASWVSSSNVYGPWGYDSIQTASFALTASYLLGGLSITGVNIKHFQLTPATTWSFNHDLKEQWPNVTVYDLNNNVLQPARINAEGPNDMSVYFDGPETGIVSVNVGGATIYINSGSSTGSVSSSYAETASWITSSGVYGPFGFDSIQTASYSLTASHIENLGYGDTWKHFQYVAATTWSFSHNMGEQWPNVTIYDLNNIVIQPGEIIGLNANDMDVRFDVPQTGIAVLSVGGLATTSSLFIVTASYANFALSASYVSGITDTFPYTGTAVVSGSIVLTGGTLQLVPTGSAPIPLLGALYYGTDGNLYLGTP